MSIETDLTNINDAIQKLAQGKQIRELTINGKKITFQNLTIDDLLKLRNDTEVRASVEAGRRRIRSRTLSGGKGL